MSSAVQHWHEVEQVIGVLRRLPAPHELRCAIHKHRVGDASQYAAERYTERMLASRDAPLFSLVDNESLAASGLRLYKSEVIWRCRPWHVFEGLEFTAIT